MPRASRIRRGRHCAADGTAYAAAKVCDDKKLCTDDSCDAKKGCVSLVNAVTCSDNDPCTTADQCQLGACVGKATEQIVAL